MATIFFSYSHNDEDLRDRLEVHLSALKRQGLIETWHDRRIIAGDDLAGKINEHLEQADIILLLVSPDFLASDYCYDVEMARAIERHEAGDARVIPVILRHCDWYGTPFGHLLAAPTDGKPIQSWPDIDEAFLNVVQTIKKALPKRERRNVVPAVATATREVARPGPRSSNLRLRKTFSDADLDEFMIGGFEYIAAFFENSLEELEKRNGKVSTAFRRIDANRFTAVVYIAGNAAARCKIVLGGHFGPGITYADDDQAADGTMNEGLSVEADEQGLYFTTLGLAIYGRTDRHLSYEGAAEYLWSVFVQPLQ